MNWDFFQPIGKNLVLESGPSSVQGKSPAYLKCFFSTIDQLANFSHVKMHHRNPSCHACVVPLYLSSLVCLHIGHCYVPLHLHSFEIICRGWKVRLADHMMHSVCK